ncbi:MAG: hypothetical protein IKM59_01605, partial [Oscillospiraceae bacterium]|nr:hypothetical protein [Oscillospiraceae bacterium]
HVEQALPTSPNGGEDEPPVVSNRLELRGAILSLIDNWKEQGTILIQDYDGDVSENLAEVMEYTTHQHPTGAYAIDYADAEILEKNGVQSIRVSFVFRRSLSEINAIVLVNNTADAVKKLRESMDNFSTSLTLRIRRYGGEDFSREIQSYCMENPLKIPAIPDYTVKLYPEEGDHRILEVHFAYPESKDSLRAKVQEIQTLFSSAATYGESGITPYDKAARLYRYLILRQNHYTLAETPPVMPLYSLMTENIAHDLSFAIYYKELCEAAGINCQIIEGSKNDVPYFWNLIALEDRAFHVDLRRCVELGDRAMISLYDEDLLNEGYVWDRTVYSAPDPEPEVTEPTAPIMPTDPTETTQPTTESTVATEPPTESVSTEAQTPTETESTTETEAATETQTESSETTEDPTESTSEIFSG